MSGSQCHRHQARAVGGVWMGRYMEANASRSVGRGVTDPRDLQFLLIDLQVLQAKVDRHKAGTTGERGMKVSELTENGSSNV
jgi:hypothetical protein